MPGASHQLAADLMPSSPQEPGHYDDYHDQGALSYAMCLLTAPGTWGTGTARGRGICPGSSRPRARVS